MDVFFFPMRDPLVEHGNPSLLEYLRWNMLETAPVSTAARKFVLGLEKFGKPPSEWRDRHSRPLLLVAAQYNYLELFKWLVRKGCSVNDSGMGPILMQHAKVSGFEKLGSYIQTQLDEE
jgi:hypothetical protein